MAVAAGGLALLAVQHPTADFKLMTHVPSDPSPARFQAAIDFGLVGVSILYTWTRGLN